MRLSALRHLVESVHALARGERICVLGSSALLASFPELGEEGGPLELTYDADLLVEPCDEKLAAMLHEAVGEGSLFAERHGYHADLLRPEITETLSPGWDERWVALDAEVPAHALAPVDLTVVKLRTGRAKDLNLIRVVVGEGRVSVKEVRKLLEKTPLEEKEIVIVYQRLDEVAGGSGM